MRRGAGVSFLIRKNTLVSLGVTTLFLICLLVGFGVANGDRGDQGSRETANIMEAAAGFGEESGAMGAGGEDGIAGDDGLAAEVAAVIRKDIMDGAWEENADEENADVLSEAVAAEAREDVGDWQAGLANEPEKGAPALSEEEITAEGDIYEGYRLERDRLRSEQVQILKEIAGSELYEDDRKREAQDRILRITEEREQELLIESALAAMGWEPCAAIVQWDKVVVIAPTSLIRPESARQIEELTAQVSGRAPEDIILVPGQARNDVVRSPE
jgi:stage III sporulation protein AH